MSVSDVCRLCLTKDNLVWIFDKRFNNSESMKDVIYITTGVEIHTKDIISQKICKKCCQVTIKMFEFRRTSLKNDKYLREECKKHLKENSIKIPNTDVIIKSEIKRNHDEVKSESKPDIPKPVFKIHPSVRDLFRVYPQIKLPTVCLSSHITPFVSMPMDDVENYFKSHKLDFNFYTRLALGRSASRKVATKKTSAAAEPKTSNSSPSSNPATAKVSVSKSESKDNVIDPIRTKTPTHNFKISEKVNTKDVDTLSRSKSKDVASKNGVKIINIDLSKSKSTKSVTQENTLASRKRKYSETEEASNKHSVKKPNFIESLGLTPKSNDPTSTTLIESPSLSYVANTSVPLHICTICNSVQYSAKDLRRHQNKHLRCQFCKTKFRTLETKTKHVENTCIIKNMMKNLPDVPLKKIEYNAKVRRKYREAFINFPPLKNTRDDKDKKSNIKNTVETTRKDTTRSNALDKAKPEIVHKPVNKGEIAHKPVNKVDIAHKPVDKGEIAHKPVDKAETAHKPIDTGEIIEIMSDDEDPPSKSANNSGVANVNTEPVPNSNNSKAESDVKAVPNNPLIPKSSSPAPTNSAPNLSNPTISSALAPNPENIVYNTVSIVKPDIRIKNNNLLENIESTEPKLTDVRVLKELLKAKPLQLFAEKRTQTELPTNESISVNRAELSSELKNLKQQLYVYKIPIIIKSGHFNVTYNYHTDVKQPKKLCLWHDLTPIDIKTIKLTDSGPDIAKQIITSETSNNQETNGPSVPTTSNLPEVEKSTNETLTISEGTNSSTILPSTASYNFPGIQSMHPQVAATTSRFVCVNTNSDNSAPNVPPNTSIIDMNPMLNDILQPQSTSCVTETTTSRPVSSSSNVGTPISNTPIPLGLIRVKDVWELS